MKRMRTGKPALANGAMKMHENGIASSLKKRIGLTRDAGDKEGSAPTPRPH